LKRGGALNQKLLYLAIPSKLSQERTNECSNGEDQADGRQRRPVRAGCGLLRLPEAAHQAPEVHAQGQEARDDRGADHPRDGGRRHLRPQQELQHPAHPREVAASTTEGGRFAKDLSPSVRQALKLAETQIIYFLVCANRRLYYLR
jgi:hypothetical protein